VAHHTSVDMMLACEPEAIYVTHYSQVRDVSRLGADLHRLIDAHRAVALAQKDTGMDAGPARHARLRQGVTEIVLGEAERYRWSLPRDRVLEILDLDIELNAQGLGSWLDTLG